MPPRKGQKNRFPLNEYLEVKRNQDALLVSALARDKEFTKKARKLKRLELKAKLVNEDDKNVKEKISVTDNLVDRRTRSPTILGDDGKISGPGRSARRRRLQTLNAAKMLHGATAESITPAYADINKSDIANTQGNFGLKQQDKWHPWNYNQRIRVAAAVEKKKEEVSKTTLKPATKREKITSFISQKKSRQESPPLVGKFINRAKAEPLHLKNNAWQQWNSSVLMYSLSRSHLGECDSILDVSLNSCFGKYYHAIRFNVKATRLAKKIRKWFADDRTKNRPLEYRFTGKESRLFCHNFMYIVESLKTDEDQNVHTFKLHVFAFTGLNLRDSVSLFSRVSMSSEQVQSLNQVCSNYFRATALFLKSTPTSWTIGHIVPVHAQQLQETLGLGLGINTMEGREAKHVTLAKFTNNTQFNNRWNQVFKHEYISLFWFRENGCDETVYKHTSNVYIPRRCFTRDFCYCGLPKDGDVEKCSFCSQHFQNLVLDCVQGETTLEAKETIE